MMVDTDSGSTFWPAVSVRFASIWTVLTASSGALKARCALVKILMTRLRISPNTLNEAAPRHTRIPLVHSRQQQSIFVGQGTRGGCPNRIASEYGECLGNGDQSRTGEARPGRTARHAASSGTRAQSR